jgi:hypothetical protein
MSLTDNFDKASGPSPKIRKRKKRAAPFSLRLSADEREHLLQEAGGAALGAYIKAKVLGTPALRMRRSSSDLQDRKAIAQVLALLGRSRIANNLNQLAHAANIGVLPITPETEDDLRETLRDVKAIRHLLMVALGLKPEDLP